VERSLYRGDLGVLADFASFRNRYPPDRLCDQGLMAITRRGRKRMTVKGWIAIFFQKTFARKKTNPPTVP
jgi:hypothetical protein